MKRTFVIEITADIPDNDPELGHEAVVASKEAVQMIEQALAKLGLTNVKASRDISRRREITGGKKPKIVKAA